MIVFENDPNYQKVNLALEGNNITTNSWVECAFYSQNGWLPPGFVFNDDLYGIYLESINGYVINNTYITYIIFCLIILYLYRKNAIK